MNTELENIKNSVETNSRTIEEIVDEIIKPYCEELDKTFNSQTEAAKELGINEDDLELYGKYKAKIDLSLFEKLKLGVAGWGEALFGKDPEKSKEELYEEYNINKER